MLRDLGWSLHYTTHLRDRDYGDPTSVTAYSFTTLPLAHILIHPTYIPQTMRPYAMGSSMRRSHASSRRTGSASEPVRPPKSTPSVGDSAAAAAQPRACGTSLFASTSMCNGVPEDGSMDTKSEAKPPAPSCPCSEGSTCVHRRQQHEKQRNHAITHPAPASQRLVGTGIAGALPLKVQISCQPSSFHLCGHHMDVKITRQHGSAGRVSG